jgi:fatty acid desaturase
MSISLKQSISLSKKKFFRAPQWELKLAARIFIGFIVLYFLVVFLALGIGLFFIIREASPDQDPVSVVNLWIIYFFGIDFLMRYFIQNPPYYRCKITFAATDY